MLTIHSNLDFEICTVDDSSPDNTVEVAKQLQRAFPGRIILQQRAEKLGFGTAYVHFQYQSHLYVVQFTTRNS